MFPFYLIEHKYRVTNAAHNSSNEFRDPLGSFKLRRDLSGLSGIVCT